MPAATYLSFLQAWSKDHPALALLALAGYELVVLGFGFVGKLVSGTADELNKRWKDPLAKSIDEGARRSLSGFGRRYRRSVESNLRFIDLKGLATMGFYTPKLDEVFVDVSLVHSDPSKVPSGVLGRRQTESDRRFIGDLIDRPKPVVLAVIGAPGCGKTTLLRHTALLVCRTRRRRRTPVLLYLRDHIKAIGDDTPLPDLIDRAAPAGWFDRKLRAGSCVVLLDGLDEVADQQNRRQVSDWVERQVASYPDNDFVITSRPHGYQTAPIAGADIVQVRGFTDEQVTRFIRSWYFAFEQRSTGEKSANIARRAEEEAADLLERLQQSTALYELTVNPLLLTMIANVHKFRGALPGSRVDLYSEICQVLLWRRQEAKKLVSELTGEQKMALLSGLAYSMMSRKLRDISRNDLRTEFRALLRRMGRGLDEDAFLADMTSSGLLIERERDLFAFAHLTFQEYLAAHHVREKNLAHLLADNVDDVWWRETTLLHVARSNADPIVEACLGVGTVNALSLAFDCADESSELAPEMRAQLDQRLDTVFESTGDTPERNLMIRVVIARYLRNLVRTDQGTHLCAEPVPTRIYRLFMETNPNNKPDGPATSPAEPVRGVRRVSAQAFTNWVNELHVTDRIYRLPTTEELRSAPLLKKFKSLTSWPSEKGNPWPLLRAVKLVMVSSTDLYRELITDLFGTFDYISQTNPSTFSPTSHGAALDEQFHDSFLSPVRDRKDNYIVPIDSLAELVESVRYAPMSDWGSAQLTHFMRSAKSAVTRTGPLAAQFAVKLRLLAVILALETDEEHADTFRRIAAGILLLQQRNDGRILPNETIVLATD
ncbi:NACHT domain-containing protein [Lentzea sp. NPDC004782]|uniref:NACHT domain-containing protein n=1 Tax=Lentzea sp. NPDC004782 TaxID=3154458 RepID=UPI0033B2E495